MTKKYYNLTLSAFMVIVTMVLVLGLAALVNAASLRICFAPPGTDTAKVSVYAGPNLVFDDILVTSSLVDPNQRCSINQIPATYPRGTTLPITLKGVNSFGEEGLASNAVTFRAPNIPGVITNTTVQGIPNP